MLPGRHAINSSKPRATEAAAFLSELLSSGPAVGDSRRYSSTKTSAFWKSENGNEKLTLLRVARVPKVVVLLQQNVAQRLSENTHLNSVKLSVIERTQAPRVHGILPWPLEYANGGNGTESCRLPSAPCTWCSCRELTGLPEKFVGYLISESKNCRG